MKFFKEGQLIRLAVLAAMGVSALGAPTAMAQAVTVIEGDLEVTGDTQVDGDLQVGSASTTTETDTTEGEPDAGILPYIVDNGDGTSTVYTVTATNATSTTTTTTTTTGDVLIEANGNITTEQGSTTTTIASTTFDIATEVLIDNDTGLPIGDAIEGVVGSYDPVTGAFVAGEPDPVVTETVQTLAGGNLTVAGTGSFGGDVAMNGNRVTGLADGVADTDAATVGQVATSDALLQSAIDDEVAARTAADVTLQSNIDAEAATRAAADVTLQSNIDAEAATRAAADVTLQSNIDAEAATRAAADVTLQSNIDAEAATRAAADVTLQSNIDAEAALRLAGDARLDRRVDTVEKGVALAMAIAAVPTVDYGRFSLGVGLGNFKGETAGAVGLGFKVGERAKFSVNFASDGDENGGSIGFAVGY